MSAHTLGHWRLHLVDDCTVIDATGRPVAVVAGDYDADWHKMEDRARLIAAAPDLLAALRALMNEFGGTRAVASEDPRAEAARAAIAKAEGR